MTNDLFQYQDYKSYLISLLDSEPGLGKGGRTRLCKAMNCQTAYLSQVLNGKAQLSTEQGDALNRFLNHKENESEYFLLLIQQARAGTLSLRDFTQKQIERVLDRRSNLKDRLKIPENLRPSQQVKYYSAWHYAAIHVLITIPRFRTCDSISKKLNLDYELVTEALEFLCLAGLAQKKGDRFEVTTERIHLGNDSDLSSRHHLNWRIQAILSIEKRRLKDLHYSSVVTLSKKDAIELREEFLKKIESIKSTIRESSAEELYSFSIDWFSLEK